MAQETLSSTPRSCLNIFVTLFLFMSRGCLVGYARKSRRGLALKLDLGLEEFLTAKRYVGKDGKEYVALVVNLRGLQAVLDGKREVTGVCQLKN